jgi:hypothetical protein
MNNNYQRYLYLKNKLNFNYKGIQYNKVLSLDIAQSTLNKNKPYTLRNILSNFFFSLDMTPLVKICVSKENIFIYSLDRSDYSFQIKETMENISSSESILIEKLKKKISFKPLRIITTFFNTYRSLKGIEGFFGIVFLASRIVFYKNIHDQLFPIFKIESNKKLKLITFNSAFTIENLICQFFNLNNRETFSLSHGFFVSYKKFIPVDIINGENIVSNKILVWGSTSIKDLYDNFNFPKERILIAGNPKYPYKRIQVKQTFKKCIVLLGRNIYHESNLEIIEILKKLIKETSNITFDLKLHPSLNTKFYKKICIGTNINVLDGNKSLLNIFKKNIYDFSIVNNSTSYYEAMYADIICLRYELSENENYKGLSDKFINTETLKNRIQYFINMDSNKLNCAVEELLISTLGMGVNNYKQIFGSNSNSF